MVMVLVENRRNRRKSTPQGGGNSPKSGDDRIGHVFVYVIARVRTGLSGLPCSRSGPESGQIFFFKFLAPTVRIPLFKRTAHTEKWTHLYIYR